VQRIEVRLLVCADIAVHLGGRENDDAAKCEVTARAAHLVGKRADPQMQTMSGRTGIAQSPIPARQSPSRASGRRRAPQPAQPKIRLSYEVTKR
jgi:hypothetical protein